MRVCKDFKSKKKGEQVNYYNEYDKKAAAWLRELIKANLIPPGVVDERSICDVRPHDLKKFKQCHFFAGIGGWPLALLLAGWGESEVWTGSCPCQPFSSAGRKQGVLDSRHLWPAFQHLIAERRPATVFGEQVAGEAGYDWIAGVRFDLESLGYAVGVADLCAAGAGAPHIRQRLYWVANGSGIKTGGAEPGNSVSGVGAEWADAVPSFGRCCGLHAQQKRRSPSGVCLLADGVSSEVDALAGFGNAIVPPLAAEFIKAFIEITN